MDSRYILDGAVEIKAVRLKKDVIEIGPEFLLVESSDIMIRGGDFYAVWLEDKGVWSTKEIDAIQLIDRETARYAEEYRQKEASPDEKVIAKFIKYTKTKLIVEWHNYCKSYSRDRFHTLDEKLIFANDGVNKTDYSSKRLPYPLLQGECPAYKEMMSVLYSDEERHKLEWAIGSIVCGDSKEIQKFIVLYGSAGTGKSTVLNIIEQLFDGYCCSFDAKALGSATSAFSLEPFKNNPLVAIQHDGDLSKIEDNTRLNSLVSHERMVVNTKNKSLYEEQFRAFLFMGTNKPVKITDAKSGLLRRLIDVSPTGNKLKRSDYDRLKGQIKFELGAIAWHCREVYLSDPHYYDTYVPRAMMMASNDFYNFVADNFFEFKKNNGTTLTAAYAQYNDYCMRANVPSFAKKSRMSFAEELKNYFEEFSERITLDGSRIRSYYRGFRSDIFEQPKEEEKKTEPPAPKLIFEKIPSLFDEIAKDWPAQYASKEGTPLRKWANVKTTLKELDTSKLHYVKVPENHIVIDFDIPDENGEKSLERNLAEASKWPETYAELSKSGKGIHLHYIYDGDVSKLSRVFAPHIEVKIFTGDSSLRRQVTLCTAAAIAHLASGLPLREEKSPMLNNASLKSERSLRKQIVNIMRKASKDGYKESRTMNTAPAIQLIAKMLDDAYESGMKYDLSDMRNALCGLALSSTHQSDKCMKLVSKMKLKSEEPPEALPDDNKRPVAFFDCEVFINLLVICWKLAGEKEPVYSMVNPSPEEVEEFIDIYDLIGFNNRKYDNHIIYARSIGLSLERIYQLSQSMINDKTGFLPQAYDISYTDIYDFSSKKQSLKKFEIELGIDHVELGIPWDQPVPEERWDEVVKYCCYDVIATEKVFEDRKADFAGRKILAKLANGTVNDTTNTLSARFIFRGDRNPQSQFNYRFMGDVPDKVYRSKVDIEKGLIFNNFGDEYTLFDEEGRPVFPGYTYDQQNRVSTYRGEEVGEGGYVYAEPGIYTNVALLDIASMHPSSAIAEKIFGEYYTDRFRQIVEARLAVKHHEFDKARGLLNGELATYLDDPEMTDGLKQALKIVINMVYGMTSAKFMNPFKDVRNVDNIVAKRGALFMINLKHEVQARGFKVAHIKTDSIKIPNATPKIIKFVMDYGEQYGYTFEHEATYERMCLVNDAVYIARFDSPEATEKRYGYIPEKNGKKGGEWEATGTQFQVPYVFKTLFSKEPIKFDDLCETKSVTSALYLDFNENLADVSEFEKDLEKRSKGGKTKYPDMDDDFLKKKITEGHCYHFVGKVGRFCPVKPGCGGGRLVRQIVSPKTGEVGYSSATGAKDWRWKESTTIQEYGLTDEIDMTYFDRLVNEAMDAIGKYGDPEWFRSAEFSGPVDEPYIWAEDDCPFDI